MRLHLEHKPKYVASHTLTDPQWANTTVLSGDHAAAIGELKARRGGELQVYGSGTLTLWLLENDLVDEMNLLIVLPEGHNAPGLPAGRAPALCDRHRVMTSP